MTAGLGRRKVAYPMRVLIADKLPDAARTHLQEAGFEVVFTPDSSGATLTEALRTHNPQALIVRSTKVEAEHIEAAKSLRLIVRAGAGVNTIDMAAASAHAVCVANCPGMNAVAVAELAFGHLLNADRRIADGVADLRAGQWRKKVYSQSHGLKGRTLGVIGCGSIGREMIQRAQAFDMRIIAWSPSLDEAAAAALGIRRAESIVDVAKRADALSVHVALTPSTRGLVGDAVFEALRPGAIFINTSRGEVVDEAALARAVREKGVRAGLDVFCGEPAADGDWQHELAGLDGVYGTHHIGASTDQAQEAVADDACRIVIAFRDTGAAPNCVNVTSETMATHLLVARHVDRVGVLAGLLGRLREANVNVQQMDNVIFSGEDGAACARIQVEGSISDELLADLRSLESVFDVTALQLSR